MDKLNKTLLKNYSLDLRLFVFQNLVSLDTIFILDYLLENANNRAADIFRKKESQFNNWPLPSSPAKIVYVGSIPLRTILSSLPDSNEKSVKTTKNKLKDSKKPRKANVEKKTSISYAQAKKNFICSLRLASERFVRSKKDRKTLMEILNRIEKSKFDSQLELKKS